MGGTRYHELRYQAEQAEMNIMTMQAEEKERRSSARLPVNPRRNKVPTDQRKRVATACNSCNVRRTRCSGQKPCSQCVASSRECVYPVTSPKVSISQSELDDLKRRVKAYDQVLQDVVPDASRRNEMLQQRSASLTPSESPSSQQQAASSPSRTEATTTTDEEQQSALVVEGRLLHDGIGTARFHGETSESAFVDNIKTFLQGHLPAGDASIQGSIGRCYTTDARPLPQSDLDSLWLPPMNTTRTLLSITRSFLQDGTDDSPSPSGGIYWWGELRSVPSIPQMTGQVEPDTRHARRLAFYNAALAVACRVASTGSAAEASRSEAFFSRAASLMGNPFDVSRCSLGQVAVFTLMAAYLIEVDRCEAAAQYIGHAMRISISLGIHRGCADERGKRIFWTLYILDRWVSCLLGRPANLADEAIRLPLPADMPSLPSAAGLRAHIELSRISNMVVCDVHRVSPRREVGEGHRASVEKAAFALEQWVQSLPPSLQLDVDGLSTDSASCTLHMHYNQLVILTYRGTLFNAVRNAHSQSWTDISNTHITFCMDASQRNMRLARHLATLHRPRRLLHAGLHHVFNAILCFLLHDLISPDTPASNREVDFAIELFKREAQTGNTYGAACAKVLFNLRQLVGRMKQGRDEDVSMEVDQGLQGLSRMTSWGTQGDEGEGAQGGIQEGMQEESLYDDVLSWMDHEWPSFAGPGS